ncbi:MAG TPA: 1-deoxy-D-xylulose-5-phosphate reductoisomerase [Clostridiales bacterium]|jgi:1-deoxy-D-xylulose-5-phosphate reductoisomerase|nr:1-deoxy-D-xylulose-5-phosphate reductoisomerase [Clostridiales bacterium]HPU66449.1 1-deoxy-D-xylulose-5-phosphate reductoisomerase [Clostridiales bacterium]HQA05139.1 1-deoxy-D-xylulose-5-phosphate reductoisomerase [Clostridiales bacterium]
MNSLIILGSTGSIGAQALDVAEKLSLKVEALTANSDAKKLEEQARKFKPRLAALADEKAAAELKIKLADTNTKVLSGIEGVTECAAFGENPTVLNSIVGMAGLRPTLAAAKAGRRIALANKESLVAGGKLVKTAVKENNAELLPVDSEHSAIFQSIQGCKDKKEIKKIILTASGGPFFGKKRHELKSVTLQDALKHPNWSMGAKITVDSATMFNKGLELIEAVWLFDVAPENIEIVVHRESIVHSLVEFADNSVIAQLGLPDMRIPIQYAITYPNRFESPVGSLNLAQIGKLTFFEPDYETFKCINICRDAINRGGLYPAAANAANEEANELFRKGKIPFLAIGDIIEEALLDIENKEEYRLEDVEEISDAARERVRRLSEKYTL